ncbi:MarR family winged helix-turn-helix transcriptional regulator [Solidesulfovibrio magneticus]|uniref:MarR family transcriptional regulator n=1 Tax=Solidesulfovibrio magneticus (strain ATCC 700980 / DSM 13731 / RS-1) TaxID=573370 RepID=C4XH31_SOLM1|nr:MarR family transcriptional regulator [Solidesulfovibrio magneticus]BAH76334.1 MarR family transcriptional regulator [Solidesulfovibrio magneticus RS-1]
MESSPSVAVPEQASESLPIALNDVARAWRSRLDERLRPLGLSSAMWAVIRRLATGQAALTQRELAEAVGIEGPTLVRLLDRLEQHGIARRVSDPRDRRIKRVELAEQARQNWDASLKAGLELSSELTRGIPPKDLETTRTVLRTMLERL